MSPLLSNALLRSQSDDRLVALVHSGQDQAFVIILERYRSELLVFARGIAGDARAEDAVQQATLKAWSALRGGTPVRNVRAWLYSIVRNAAFDMLPDRTQVHEELHESLAVAEGPEAVVERRIRAREALTAVAALPPHQRDALIMTGVAGHSGDEVAGRLGISAGAVRQLVHRARHTLRAAATAITPLPLVAWAAARAGQPSATRMAELSSGAGAGAAVVKVCATLVAVGAVGGVATQLRSGGSPPPAVHHAARPRPAVAPGASAASTPLRSLTATPPPTRPPRQRGADVQGKGTQHGPSGSQGPVGTQGASGSHGGAGVQGASGAQGASRGPQHLVSTLPAAGAVAHGGAGTQGDAGAQGPAR